jgi:hypothetical protein
VFLIIELFGVGSQEKSSPSATFALPSALIFSLCFRRSFSLHVRHVQMGFYFRCVFAGSVEVLSSLFLIVAERVQFL